MAPLLQGRIPDSALIGQHILRRQRRRRWAAAFARSRASGCGVHVHVRVGRPQQ